VSGITRLPLASLVAAVGLVDDVEPATPAHHAVVAMAIAQGPQRILDLHGNASIVRQRKRKAAQQTAP
jgi:hypothetical protein